MAAVFKVLNDLADIKSAGGVALRVRTQGGTTVALAKPTGAKQLSSSKAAPVFAPLAHGRQAGDRIYSPLSGFLCADPR
jgi:hypothetical protein